MASGPSHVALLPYIAIGAAFGLAVMVGWGSVQFPLNGILLGATAITATVVLRQVMAQRDNVRLMGEFRTLATTDALTHLANRRYFLDVAQRHLHGTGREDLFLIMADLDHFKSINDTFGHSAGDDALSWVARHCKSVLPSDAVVGRLGGDEFVALLPGHTLGLAMIVADQLAASISSSVGAVPAGPERLTVSLGVASARDCPDVATLLHLADGALYEAKRSGRNRACAHPTLETTTADRPGSPDAPTDGPPAAVTA